MNKTKTLQHICLTILVLFAFDLSAQVVGNEWVNFDQAYYKIGVRSDGIYRLTYSDLRDGGFPVNLVKPENLQLFYRGEEQPIVVQAANEDFLTNGDYIEFYGKRNDGTLDAWMYEAESFQANPYENLYSHTSYYFLTYALDGTLGKRKVKTNINPSVQKVFTAYSPLLSPVLSYFLVFFGKLA